MLPGTVSLLELASDTPLTWVYRIKHWCRSPLPAFPEVQLTLGNRVAEGNFVVSNFVLRGTHLGLFLGIPPAGKFVDAAGVSILRFEGPTRFATTWCMFSPP